MIGLSVFGGFSKGYWENFSHIDWGLIVEGDPDGLGISQDFQTKIQEQGFVYVKKKQIRWRYKKKT